MSIFKPETPKLLQTEDGSHTLHLESIDETYHSHAGALTESIHVYINNGLKLLQNLNTIKILEVGFGTGMNAILTLLENQNDNKKIIYHSLEPYPIPLDLVAHLDMGDISKDVQSAALLMQLHTVPDNAEYQIAPGFYFTRFRKTLHEFDAGVEHYDLVYYDAFAPRKQPEMWTEEVLQKTVISLRQGGLLTTYCANGQFKRNLKSMGLSLQNPPGIGGRKEITLGRKI